MSPGQRNRQRRMAQLLGQDHPKRLFAFRCAHNECIDKIFSLPAKLAFVRLEKKKFDFPTPGIEPGPPG